MANELSDLAAAVEDEQLLSNAFEAARQDALDSLTAIEVSLEGPKNSAGAADQPRVAHHPCCRPTAGPCNVHAAR